jgi:DNA invertase Pin-like site-specific DNA recombinase
MMPSLPFQRRDVVGIVRVSSDKQAKDDKDGISRQERDIKFLVKKHNLHLVKTFYLVFSGAVVTKTKEFRSMLEYVSRSEIAGLVVACFDRLSRKATFSDIGDMLRPFEEIVAGKGTKRIWCDFGELDVLNHDDKQKIWNALNYAEVEREKIAYRTGSAREELRANGTACVDRLPAGVKQVRTDKKINDGYFEYTPASVKIKTAFERLLAGDTIRAITHDLGFGSQTALRKSLKSEWWIGNKTRLWTCVDKVWDAERDRHTTGKRVAHPTPIRERTNLADSPLVSVEMFDAVQAILNCNHKTWTQKKSIGENFLATGLLYCQCGRKMYLKMSKTNPAYYSCASRVLGGGDCHEPTIKATVIDEAINFAAVRYLRDKKVLEAIVKESRNADRTLETERAIERAEKDLSDLSRRKGNILAAIEQGAGELADHAAALGKIKTDTAEAQTKLRTLNADLATALSDNDVETITDQIATDFMDFPVKDMAVRKGILNHYIRRINVIFPAEHKITHEVLVTFDVKPGLPLPTKDEDGSGPVEPATGYTGNTGNTLRVKQGPDIEGPLPLPRKTTKLETVSRTGSLLLPSA